MTNQKFSKKEAIKFGWETVMSNFLFFLGLLFVWGAVSFFFNVIAKELKEVVPVFSFFVKVAGFIVATFINMGVLYISLRFADKIKPSYRDFLIPAKHFISFLLASILYGLIVFVGFILLIIPGIIWSIKFNMYRYAVVEEGLGPIEALKRSAKITQGSKWNLFLFSLLLVLINMLGILAFGFGLLITLPVSFIAMAYVYRKLLVNKAELADTTESKKNQEISQKTNENPQ